MADTLTAGGNGTDGRLDLLGAEGKPILDVQVTTRGGTLHDANLTLGGAGRSGLLRVMSADDQQAATISGSNLNLGGKGRTAERGQQGSISLYNSDSRNPININATKDRADVLLGDAGVAGYIQLSNGNNGPGPIIEVDGKRNALSFGNPGSPSTSMVDIVGSQALVRTGGEGVSGKVSMVDGKDQETIRLTAANATARIGGNGVNGTLSVLGADGKPLLELLGGPGESAMGLGQRDRPARISLYNGSQAEALRLDAATGDIMLLNADCAEEFDVEDGAEPGMVMVLAADGSLSVGERPYDTRVAGVVSGAGTYRPGLILDRRDTGRRRAPIALMGKVFCLAAATDAPIAAGDLLTTSAYAGHAMRIGDRDRATGAVLGKALGPLRSGRGLIPVLVTLQ
jgi:hypothetical protein